jgi:hypothetical protein
VRYFVAEIIETNPFSKFEIAAIIPPKATKLTLNIIA